MKKAVWGSDYDFRTDKCFQRPMCPECNELIPVFRTDKKHPELAECISCHKVVLLTDEMRKWFSKREEVKTKTETCLKCGKKTMVTRYHRNEVTLKWQAAFGSCEECGARFIV